MRVLIRKATSKDLSDVQKLNKMLFESDNPYDGGFLNLYWPLEKEGQEYFSRRVSEQEGVCFIAEMGGQTVGYLVAKIDDSAPSYRPIKRAELENMLVLADYRSQGIGQQLVEAFLQWSKQQKARRVFVKAYAPNKRAIRFYERLGFKPHVLELEGGIDQDFKTLT